MIRSGKAKSFSLPSEKYSEILSSNICTASGLLYKKGGKWVSNWKRRSYIITTNKQLLYFDTITGEARGILSLLNAQIETSNPQHVKKSGCGSPNEATPIALALIVPEESRRFEMVRSSSLHYIYL